MSPADAGAGQALYLTEPGEQGAVNVADIDQGETGDCYLLAAIGEEAIWSPSLISNAITDNGNGTQTVKLYTQTGYDTSGAPTFALTPQTVSDASFFANGVNTFYYSSANAQVNGIKEIWPSVMEQAIAQSDGGYLSIALGGDPASTMEQLTGLNAADYSPIGYTAEMLRADQAAGDLIVFGTAVASSIYNLEPTHAYMYEGLTTINGVTDVLVGNPWGYNQATPIPVSDLATAFNQVDVGPTKGTPNLAAPYTPPPATTDLVVYASENAYQGDAQFSVTVDGIAVGGVHTVTALHSGITKFQGAVKGSQAFDIGQFANSQHQVGITFLNDAWGGSAATDRNLYVDNISLAPPGQQHPLDLKNGTLDGYGGTTTQTSTFGIYGQYRAPPSPGLVLSLHEDAWMGDAEYTLAVDGKAFGGIRNITPPTGLGTSSGPVVDVGALAVGQHTVSVSLINDAYGGSPSTDRNLYLDSATYDGAQVKGSTASLYSNGTFHFTVQATLPVSGAPSSDDTQAKLTPERVNAGTSAGMRFVQPAGPTATMRHAEATLPAENGSRVALVHQIGIIHDLIPTPIARTADLLDAMSGWGLADTMRGAPASMPAWLGTGEYQSGTFSEAR